MAATLTAGQEALTYFSFPIAKSEDTAEVNPVDGTPDLVIWGKATDGTIDGDQEIVDPAWSAKAIQEWFDTKANIRMAHDPKRPVGKGVDIALTSDGHWVKSKICDPLAKHFIRNGILNDYSVGISNPAFRYGDQKLDPLGKARRIITGHADGSSRISEITVCDRGSNFNSAFQLAKAAADGSCLFTGKMLGSDDELLKAAPAELIKRTAVPAAGKTGGGFSPNDLSKLLEARRIAEQRQADTDHAVFKAMLSAEAEVYKRDIDTATRRRLRSQGRALPNLSYPVETREDADNAVTLILSGHGNVGAARKLVRRVARKEGWTDILDRLDGKKKEKAVEAAPETEITDKSTAAEPAAAAAPPEVAKDDGGDAHEAVLHHDDGEDDDTDSDADAMDKSAEQDAAKAAAPGKKPKVPCPSCGAKCKAGCKYCSSCGKAMTAEKASKPVPDGGAVGAAESAIQPVPEHREPDGPAIEALEHDAHLPTVPDSSVKTAMHLRTLGVPAEQGMLHGLLCPAYGEASVKAAWPDGDLSLIDEQAWQAKALEVAASAPLEDAQKAAQVWTAAHMLKQVPADLHADVMEEARKAFRDANPGPGKAPEPGELSAQRFNRPYITAGHAAPSPGHDGPNTAPVHPGHISASDFRRDLITAGHAAGSPENDPGRTAPVPAPEVPGVPSRVFYTNVQRQNAAQAMRAMHDHIAQTFPDLCPMHGPGRMGEPPSHARPVPAGVGGPVPHGAAKADEGGILPAGPAPAVNATGVPEHVLGPGQARRLAKKAEKRRVRELMEAVFKGEQTLDAARAELGLAPINFVTAPPVAKAAASELPPVVTELQVGPDIEAIVTKATAPLLEKMAALEAADAEHQRLLHAMASQPDPAVTAYRGAAVAHKTSAPALAGPAGIAERAALAQDNLVRELFATARNSPDPQQRTEAWGHLMSIHGVGTAPG